MHIERERQSGTLRRLLRDRRGNTLAMVAMSLVPLSAMIGSGVDVSRTYLVKSRLQAACDAGALAARKVMDGSATLTAPATAAGDSFFRNNFPVGTYGTTAVTFSTLLNTDREVVGQANATVPMSVMKMFGYETLPVVASCSARLDITNTDVMFVLDVTGSMLEDPDGTGGQASERPTSRIVALRKAVVDFWDTMNASAPATAQIRYGFVPYAQGVNVAGLLTSSQLVSEWGYQSRIAVFETPTYIAQFGTPVETTETYASSITTSQCDAYGINRNWPTTDGATHYSSTPPASGTRTVYRRRDFGASGTADREGNERTCRRYKVDTPVTYLTKYRFTRWDYERVTYNTSDFKAGVGVRIASANPPTSTTNTFMVDAPGRHKITDLPNTVGTRGTVWNASLPAFTTATYSQNYTGTMTNTVFDGCVEERDTIAAATYTYGSIDANGKVWDLDVDTAPSTTANTWRPTWPNVVYTTTGARPGYACPTRARTLATMTKAEVQTYVNSLVATGTTFHTAGMTWGTRLLSPTGLYATLNNTTTNNQPISRNIIFMTDGQMNADEDSYGLWGYERRDMRVTAGDFNSRDARHNSRYVALCDLARSKNIRIWVVAFGTTLNTQMTQCADTGQAFTSTDEDDLRADFAEIATKIAKLRLSQ